MNTEKIATEALKKAAEKLTPDFRQEALNAGWPSQLVMQLTVEESEGELYVQYADILSSEVEDLEYGTPDTLPTAVIRNFMSRHSDKMNNIFETAFEDVAVSLGAFK